jgi:hypothetical protein
VGCFGSCPGSFESCSLRVHIALIIILYLFLTPEELSRINAYVSQATLVIDVYRDRHTILVRSQCSIVRSTTSPGWDTPRCVSGLTSRFTVAAGAARMRAISARVAASRAACAASSARMRSS